jgi:Flp pilus assembly protein TadG
MKSNVLSRIRRLRWRRRGLAGTDDGTVSVEFMLWMPLIFTIILFTVDVALIYLKQADMWNVARDQSRRMSVDSTYNPTQAQIQALLFSSLSSATVTTSGATTAGTDKVVTIQVPLCTASLFGVVGCYDNSLNLTARVTMASEY